MSEDRRQSDVDIAEIKGDVKLLVSNGEDQVKKIDKLFDMCEAQHEISNATVTRVTVLETINKSQPTPRQAMGYGSAGGGMMLGLVYLVKKAFGG